MSPSRRLDDVTPASRTAWRVAWAATLVLGLAGAVSAQDFQIVGARALGMGGAHVAATNDETAVYWNPGALALAGSSLAVLEGNPPKGEPLHVSGGFGSTPGEMSLNDAAEVVGDLVDILNGKTTDPAKIARTVERVTSGVVNEDFGADVLANGSLLLHYGYFGGGVVSILDVAGVPRVSPGTTLPESPDEIDLEDIPVEVAYVGGLFVEVPVAASYPVLDWLSVGAALKYIWGRTYANATPIEELDSDTYFEDVFSRAKSSSNFGVDAGLLVHDRWLSLGLLARNLNAPRYDLPAGSQALGLPGSIELGRQIRAGAALRPNELATVALDFDLIPVPTLISELQTREYDAQNLAVGLELEPVRYVDFRVGFYWNLAESQLGPIVTGGIGANVGPVSIDLAGAFALGSTEIEGYTVTEEMRLAAGLAYRM